jgi:hypothetical protein
MSDTFFKVDRGSQLKEDEDYKVGGFINRFTILKNRSNTSGKQYNVVFDPKYGYSNLLTNLEYLKDNKLIEMKGSGTLVPGCDIKFTKGTVVKVAAEHPELAKAISNMVKKHLIAKMPRIAETPVEPTVDEEAMAASEQEAEVQGLMLGAKKKK